MRIAEGCWRHIRSKCKIPIRGWSDRSYDLKSLPFHRSLGYKLRVKTAVPVFQVPANSNSRIRVVAFTYHTYGRRRPAQTHDAIARRWVADVCSCWRTCAVQVRARYIAYVTRLAVDLAIYQIRSDEDSTFFLRGKGRYTYTHTHIRTHSFASRLMLRADSWKIHLPRVPSHRVICKNRPLHLRNDVARAYTMVCLYTPYLRC